MDPTLIQVLIYAAVGVGGYLLRHNNIHLPLLPKPTDPNPASPASTDLLTEIRDFLKQLLQPPTSPPPAVPTRPA